MADTSTNQSGGLLGRLGPGILMAGAAIGVSHLVQATRAGASYGTQLILIVLLINVFKYPFFEYGHRYAAATGESLLHGYARLGQGYLYAFLALVGLSSVITIAGVAFVTAGLAQAVFGGALNPTIWSLMLIGGCVGLLAVGHYRWLDVGMKIVMTLLLVATSIALGIAVTHGPVAPETFASPRAFDMAALGFLIALMGWMPAPIEGAAFQSLWVRENDRSRASRTSLAQARFDFNTGYALTIIMAVVFLLLGAYVMHGSGVEFSNSAAGFAGQVVDLYTRTLGAWTGPFVAIAALTTMVSTLLAIVDAYPRSLAVGIGLARGDAEVREGSTYWTSLWAIALFALVIIHSFLGGLRTLIDLATTVAFLAAPVLGWLNFQLITSKHTPLAMRPGRFLRVLSVLGLVYFVGFGLLFIVHRFLPGLLPA